MTREEAILLLHDMKDTYDEIHENTNYETGYEQMTALDMAIEALKAKTDGDIISRQDAIDAMGEEPPVWYDGDDEIAERNQWRRDKAAIESLPSAEPKAGEWVEHIGGISHELYYFCDQCYGEVDTNDYNFCPYCGSYNGGDDE